MLKTYWSSSRPMGLEETCLKSKGRDYSSIIYVSSVPSSWSGRKGSVLKWRAYNLDRPSLRLANSAAVTTHCALKPHAKALKLLKTGADLHDDDSSGKGGGG